MITGNKKRVTTFTRPEGNYRELKGLNQSMLGTFDENPMQFYNEFILGQPRKKKVNVSFQIGDLADFYLLDCHGDEEEFNQRFDEKFSKFDGKKGTAQAYVLADYLFDITQRDCDEDGIVTTDFTERFKEAFNLTQAEGKYSGKTWEKGLEDFNKPGKDSPKTAKDYFDLKLTCIGKEVVELWQVDRAIKIINNLRTDEFLGDFINQDSNREIEVLKKVAMEFQLGDWICKSELDFIHIDHLHKKILRRDLKTSFDNEEWSYSYLNYYYYLQNGFYDLAVRSFALENGLADYEVCPMDFLVLDTSPNARRPLLYETTPQHVLQGLKGFDYRDKHYRGVFELVNEITWANENNIWNISKENYLNKGVLTLKEYLKT